jgi:mRNA-degrading endonuclease RelE of RelBE toxin-antitoxin system
MKKWKIRLTPEASRLASALHPEIKKLIKQNLKELQNDPHRGKDLQEDLAGFKSLRLRQYRIIYDLDEQNAYIQIYYIGPRRDVYEQFSRLLTQLYKDPS